MSIDSRSDIPFEAEEAYGRYKADPGLYADFVKAAGGLPNASETHVSPIQFQYSQSYQNHHILDNIVYLVILPHNDRVNRNLQPLQPKVR